MHVAGPILHAQDVARLGDVGQQRVVAGIFPVMGVEATEGPAHGGAGAHDGAIDVDRQPRQGQALDRVSDEVVVELDQRGQGGLGELAQPVADGARRRDPRQAAEARDEGITGDIAQVLQPPGTDVEQRQDEQGETTSTVISPRARTGGAQAARELTLPQVAAEQLQPAVRGQLLVHELDMQLSLDHSSQARYAQTHQGGLLCVGSDMGMSSPLKNAQEAVLFHGVLNQFTPHLFSDWG